MKILCVEDDKNLGKLLKKTLASQHHEVELATDGQSGWDLAEAFSYDLILLDLILPELDGIRFCQQLRCKHASALNSDTPVLLMTGLDGATNRVMGLDAGADDYVTKPLDIDELMARVRALLRRSQANRSPLLTWGELCLNPTSCKVTFREQLVSLASKEYEILELFLRNPDQIFSSSRLLDRLWTAGEVPAEGAVRSHMKGLRQKLKQVGADNIFETIYKLGYRLKPQTSSKEEKGDRENTRNKKDRRAVMASLSPVPPELRAVWQECRQDYCDRLSILEQAVAALQVRKLTQQEKQKAEREVHTLIGSLGSFGLDEASHLSRQIQQLLKREESITQSEINQLLQLIATLRQHLEASSPSAVSSPSLPLSPLPNTAKLLIIDDDPALAKQLSAEAIACEIQTEIATSLQQARQSLLEQIPDVILLDLNFTDSDEGGLTFLAELRRQYVNIPVLVFTAEQTLAKRVEATRLGCQSFLQKPITPAQVLAAVAQVLQQSTRSAGRLLIVDDDPNLLQLLHTLLSPQGYQVTLLNQPDTFWQTLEQTAPDLVILDVDLQGYDAANSVESLSGIDLCQVIRSDPRWNRLPVLFLSAHTDAETIHQGFAARADDFLNKPVVAADLLTRIQTRLEQRQLWNAMEIDELTGVSLRRKTLQDLTRLFQLAKRQQQPLSLAILDLDHFKQINDDYGHKTGDRVLRHLGKLLLQCFRAEDVVGRWGGEEFVVVMYGMSKQDGSKRLAEVLDRLRQRPFIELNSISFSVTFSAGIAQFVEDGDDWQTLYQKADLALYQAKARGRSRIVTAGMYRNEF